NHRFPPCNLSHVNFRRPTRDMRHVMEKTDLLENLTAATAQAEQGKVNVEAQKIVVDALKAVGKNPDGAERILDSLQKTQNDNLSDLMTILNALEEKPQ